LCLGLLAGCDDLFNLEPIAIDDGGLSTEASDAFESAFDPDQQCPGYDLALYAGSRYRIISGLTTPWEAHDDCRDDLPGISHLAVASSNAERDVLLLAIENRSLSSWWMGGVQPVTATTPSDAWLWVTGEPFDKTRWAMYEPNDAGGEVDEVMHHYEQFTVLTAGYGLADLGAGSAFGGLCECDGRSISSAATMAIDQLRR